MSNLNVFQRFVETLISQHGFNLTQIGATLKLNHPEALPLMLNVTSQNQLVVAHYLNDESGNVTLRDSITVDVSAENWLPIALTELIYPNWTPITHKLLTETDNDPLDFGAIPKRLHTNNCVRAHICGYAATWANSLQFRGWLDTTLVYVPLDYDYRVSDSEALFESSLRDASLSERLTRMNAIPRTLGVSS